MEVISQRVRLVNFLHRPLCPVMTPLPVVGYELYLVSPREGATPATAGEGGRDPWNSGAYPLRKMSSVQRSSISSSQVSKKLAKQNPTGRSSACKTGSRGTADSG